MSRPRLLVVGALIVDLSNADDDDTDTADEVWRGVEIDDDTTADVWRGVGMLVEMLGCRDVAAVVGASRGIIDGITFWVSSNLPLEFGGC